MDEHAAESARTKTVSRFSYDEFVTNDVHSSPEPAKLTHPTRPEGTIQAGRGPSPILTSYLVQ